LKPILENGNEATLGDVAEVAYTADHAFWKATGS
jgi:hypothetical protein